MSSNGWARCKLEDIAVFHDSLRVPLNSREREKRKGNYPYYGASGVVDYVDDYIFEGEYVLISEDGENLRSRQTPIAFKVEGKFWVNNHAHVIKGKEPFLNDWIVYFFQNLDINPFITGAVQPKLNKENLQLIEITLPEFRKAKKIVSILSALDDKIELNRQANATLEAMAQSIFREWFVDGEDIDDWEVGKLGDIAENIRRSVQPSEIEPDTPYIGLEHMPRKSIALSEWDTASDVMSNKYQFKQDEFLFGKLRPYFHKVGVAPLDGVSSTDILVVAPKEDDYYGVVLGHISSVDLINHTTAASTGTKMPRTNWSDIARYEIALPPKERAKQFSGFMKSVVQLIQSNIMEARTLASIRDILLPKLMSGEIEVSND